LLVWQHVAEDVYRAAIHTPADWKYAMANETVRAAAPVPANIAEGYGRDSTGSYLQFLKVARGSLKELETHLLLGQRVGALPGEQADRILLKLDGVGRMLNGLIRAVRSSKNAATGIPKATEA
jgi:four helix bundle protein